MHSTTFALLLLNTTHNFSIVSNLFFRKVQYIMLRLFCLTILGLCTLQSISWNDMNMNQDLITAQMDDCTLFFFTTLLYFLHPVRFTNMKIPEKCEKGKFI